MAAIRAGLRALGIQVVLDDDPSLYARLEKPVSIELAQPYLLLFHLLGSHVMAYGWGAPQPAVSDFAIW